MYIYTRIPSQTRKGTILQKRYDSWSWPSYFWSGPEIWAGSLGNVPFSKNRPFSDLGGDKLDIILNQECINVHG